MLRMKAVLWIPGFMLVVAGSRAAAEETPAKDKPSAAVASDKAGAKPAVKPAAPAADSGKPADTGKPAAEAKPKKRKADAQESQQPAPVSGDAPGTAMPAAKAKKP